MREGPDLGNCNGASVDCRSASTGAPLFKHPADAWECVSGEYRAPTIVDGLMLVGSSCVDLR
jgi:hypothetical protein